MIFPIEDDVFQRPFSHETHLLPHTRINGNNLIAIIYALRQTWTPRSVQYSPKAFGCLARRDRSIAVDVDTALCSVDTFNPFSAFRAGQKCSSLTRIGFARRCRNERSSVSV